PSCIGTTGAPGCCGDGGAGCFGACCAGWGASVVALAAPVGTEAKGSAIAEPRGRDVAAGARSARQGGRGTVVRSIFTYLLQGEQIQLRRADNPRWLSGVHGLRREGGRHEQDRREDGGRGGRLERPLEHAGTGKGSCPNHYVARGAEEVRPR